MSAVYILFAFTSLTIAGDTRKMLLILDDLTPEWYFGLYTGEKSEVDILTFFRLDMATGRRGASLGLAARPLSAWCLE